MRRSSASWAVVTSAGCVATARSAAVVVCAALASAASASIVSYEPFVNYNYSTVGNTIVGQTVQGTGYTGTWSGQGQVVAGGLTYPNLVTGDAGRARSPGDTNSQTARANINLTAPVWTDTGLINTGLVGGGSASGTLYWSFLIRNNTSNSAANKFAFLQLYRGNTEGFGLGDAWASTTFQSSNGTAIGSPATSVENNNTYLMVARIDFTANATDTVQVWLNPDVLLTESGQVASISSTITGQDLSFDNVRFRAGNNWNSAGWDFDEVRFGTTWRSVLPTIPEPASLALAGAGLVLIGLRRRRA